MSARQSLKPYVVHDENGDRIVWLPGRVAWALDNLMDAGAKGCTPIDTPGPRWSAYVHKLRNDFGIDVETVVEMHGPPFPGKHARYILRSSVSRVEREAA